MLWLNAKKTDDAVNYSLSDNGKTPEETELSAKADMAIITATDDFYVIYSKSWTNVKGYKVAGETIALDPKNDWLGKSLKVNIQRVPVRKGRVFQGQQGADTLQVLSHKLISSLIEANDLVGKVINLKKLFLDTKDEARTKCLIEGTTLTGDPYESEEQKKAILPIYESIYFQYALVERTEENQAEYDSLLSDSKAEVEKQKSVGTSSGKNYTPAEKYEDKLKAKEAFLVKHLSSSKGMEKGENAEESEPTLFDILSKHGLDTPGIVTIIVEASRI